MSKPFQESILAKTRRDLRRLEDRLAKTDKELEWLEIQRDPRLEDKLQRVATKRHRQANRVMQARYEIEALEELEATLDRPNVPAKKKSPGSRQGSK